MLSPDGGVLDLDAPLTFAGDIVDTGNAADAAAPAAAAAVGGGARRGLLGAGAPVGTVTLKCGNKTKSAFRIL